MRLVGILRWYWFDDAVTKRKLATIQVSLLRFATATKPIVIGTTLSFVAILTLLRILDGASSALLLLVLPLTVIIAPLGIFLRGLTIDSLSMLESADVESSESDAAPRE